MKKFYTLLSALLLIGGTASAQYSPTFAEFPSYEVMNSTGGAQVTGISTNGRYIIGGTYVAGGFVYDVETGKFMLESASGVSHDGTAVAGLFTRNLHTGRYSMLQRPSGSNSFLMTTGISGDGHVVTGTGGADWTQLRPYCWVDGRVRELPYPTTADVGNFKVNGCRANGVSDDGSVIWGNFIANPNTNLLIIWERQADGSYEYVDVWSDLYEPQYGYVYDYDRKEYDFIAGPNPYPRMEPYAMSGNGKLVLLRVQENTGGPVSHNKIGIYHVDTRTLELAPWDPQDIVGRAGDFDSRGIANDGTVVGISRVANLSDAVPFIMYPGEHPTYLNDAFPQFERLSYYEQNSFGGLPYLLTVISEDSRYIAGYSTDIYEYSRDEGVTADFGFWGFVIDTQAEAVEPDEPEDPGITDDPVEPEDPNDDPSDDPNDDIEEPQGSGVNGVGADLKADAYYTLEGLRVENPVKGNLYIVRGADGKTRKVIF